MAEKEDLMRQHVECPICFHLYNTNTKRPHILSCGHTFCSECIMKLLNRSRSTIICPQDRQECDVPFWDVMKLPKNLTILSLMEMYCDDCTKNMKQHSCIPEHCTKVLCANCKDKHCQSFHSQVKTAITELRKEASRLLAISNEDSELSQLLAEAEAVISEVTRLCDDLKMRIIAKMRSHIEQETDHFVEWKTELGQTSLMAKSYADKTIPRLVSSYGGAKSDEVQQDIYHQAYTKREELLKTEKSHPAFKSLIIDPFKIEFEEVTSYLVDKVVQGNTEGHAVSSYMDISYKTCSEGCSDPCGISVSPNGYVAVADSCNHQIHILNNDLTTFKVFGCKGSDPCQFRSPTDVAFNANSELFISDTINHRIQVTDVNGTFKFMFGSLGSGPDEFHGIASAASLLYICDKGNHRIKVTKEDGTFMKEIGSKGNGPGQFVSNPLCIAVSIAQNTIVVSDNDGHLYFFQISGSSVGTLKKKPPFNLDATGLAFDRFGNIMVADFAGKRLMILTQYGATNIIATESDMLWLESPRGVAFSESGNILVCGKNSANLFCVSYN